MKKDKGTNVEQVSDDVKIITPRHVLREKIGYGGIDPVLLDRAEEFIASNDVVFQPFAVDFLGRLTRAIEDARKSGLRDKDTIDLIARPVMELKANGGMFGYPLVSNVADILLNFMEGLEELNDDAVEIIDVHVKTLNVIVASDLSGKGGKEGKHLADELYDACRRYEKKHGKKEDQEDKAD